MRFLILIFIIAPFFKISDLKGQEFCTHDIPYDSTATLFYPVLGGRNLDMKLIKIYFHVYRNDSGGEGVNIDRLNQMISLLNDDFEGTNFTFYYNECEVRWVDDTDLMLSEDPCHFLFQGFEHGDGIDIHVKPDAHGLGQISGKASKIPGGELVIGGTAGGGGTVVLALTHDLTHEVGHCLGLFHTFHGTCNEQGTNCDFTPFPAGNPTDGDFVNDTPPDPKITGQWMNNCVWTGYKECNYEEEYDPLTDNYMSYAPNPCKHSFTTGQISRMHALVWPEVVHEVAEGCCVSGENPPILTSSLVYAQCPMLSFDLSTLFNGIYPINTVLIWSTDSDAQDGLYPIINPVVNQNGTYYAYFYDEDTNCYSASAPVEIILPTDCCILDSDIYITSDVSYTMPQVSTGNIYVQSGKTLTINTYVEFVQNKGIIVQSGGKLILEGQTCMLNKCQNATFWAGVKIEDGGELLVREAYFYNAWDAVYAMPGSKIDIDNIIIFGLGETTGAGIRIEDDVDVVKLNNIKIHDVSKAVDILNNSPNNVLLNINGGEINNVQYGISSFSRSLIVDDVTITNSNYGLLLYFCPGSILLNSYLGYSEYGLIAGWSPLLWISNNQFTINQNAVGKVGINLFLCGNSTVAGNQTIEATNVGVNLWQSPSTTVSYNIINIDGVNNQYGGGVKINSSSSCTVGENYFDINQSSFGVETVGSNGSRIHNNQVDHFSTISTRTAAIRSMGSSGETIELNNAFGVANTTGILAQNTSFNQYHCNVTTDSKEGLGVYYNSEMQNIQANEMDDATDLAIRSAVGTQWHHGNQFYGGKARADELILAEVQNSQFFVNDNIGFFMPSDVMPSSGWFFNESEEEYSQCDPDGGPSWTPFNGNNPNGICSYYSYLKSIADERPNQFKVKMIHLVKYLKKQKKSNFPELYPNR